MITKIVRLTGIASAAAIFAVSAGLAVAAEKATTIAEHLNKDKYTKSEIKSYMKNMKGEEVRAEGKVHDVESGKRGDKVVVWIKVPGREKDFVVDVMVDDASKFHKDQAVACSGEFMRYNTFSLNGITLKDGKCSKK